MSKNLKLELEAINLHESIEYFTCTNGSINKYLKEDSYYEHLMCFANTKLVKLEVAKNELRVVAFFTMEFKKVRFSEDGDDIFYPCICLKYIATDKNYEGMGIGSKLLKYIIATSKDISDFIGCRCLFIDAVKEDISWYLDRGFQIVDEESVDNGAPTVEMFVDFRDNKDLEEYFEE